MLPGRSVVEPATLPDWSMAEQMLGIGFVALSSRIRRIYCRLPEPDNGNQSIGDH